MTLIHAATAESYLFPGEELTRLQRCALRAVLRGWSSPKVSAHRYATVPDKEWMGSLLHSQSERFMREEVRAEYGSVLAMWLLITAAGAALSWLIERLLQRVFPDKEGYGLNLEVFDKMNEWSGACL